MKTFIRLHRRVDSSAISEALSSLDRVYRAALVELEEAPALRRIALLRLMQALNTATSALNAEVGR
jgi:hypothetical protein